MSSTSIATGVDQIAYDSTQKKIYSVGKGGLSASLFADGRLSDLGSIQVPAGTHTLAVDPKSHSVWICFTEKKHSFFQEYKPAN